MALDRVVRVRDEPAPDRGDRVADDVDPLEVGDAQAGLVGVVGGSRSRSGSNPMTAAATASTATASVPAITTPEPDRRPVPRPLAMHPDEAVDDAQVRPGPPRQRDQVPVHRLDRAEVGELGRLQRLERVAAAQRARSHAARARS